MLSIKEMVQDNKQVSFVKFRNGELVYRTEDGFEFPVPVSGIGSATFHGTEKALLLMRYIRKHVDLIGQARAESIVAA